MIDKAVDYISRCQEENGAFRYALNTPKTSVAMTAAGLTILNSAGRYDGDDVRRGMEHMWGELSVRYQGAPMEVNFPFYERLYVAQALWQSPDRRQFDEWYESETKRILERQLADGSWESPQFGKCYATAINCLVLSLPEGLLPIFQR